MGSKNNVFSDINEIKLVNVTLRISEFSDPILEAIDFDLPIDEVLVIESSKNESAALFLKCMAGHVPLSNGKILWNNENIFNTESPYDPRLNMGCFFENYCADPNETVYSVLNRQISDSDVDDILEYFELTELSCLAMKSVPYRVQKLCQLIKAAYVDQQGFKQVLILEDPASGLDEAQWLCFLDFIQRQQRKGFLRHVFMTNHHPTALRHVGCQKMFIEGGLIYFQQDIEAKKINHF